MLGWLLALPFAAAGACLLLPRHRRATAEAIAAAVMALGLWALLASFDQVADAPLQWRADWLPQHGVDLVLRLDGLAWLFALLVFAIGALVVLYARYYMAVTDAVPRLHGLLLLFVGAMLGVLLSGNLVMLVIFWELTSLASFLLIGYWYQRAEARRAARHALAVTGAGGLCLLAAVLLLGHVAGSYDLDAVLAARAPLQSHALYPLIVTLVLLAACTKSAQFPFHGWLPAAMAAPTPVSAYLHSATLVKAGVFLLARLWPVLAGTETWFWSVSSIGLVTLLLGAWHALHQHDLKGLLAYSTISHLGLITLLLGLNSPLAAAAALFHVINHATFKASLFMAAGIIEHEAGSRDLRKLNGLARTMPVTATLAMVASAAMAGVPLVNGFLSKEMFFAETLQVQGHWLFGMLLPDLAILAGLLGVAYSLRFCHDVFFNGVPVDLPRTPHEPPRWMRVPLEALVMVCLLVGIAPGATVGPVLALAAGAVAGPALPPLNLALWHGLGEPLAMSLLALAGGVALYFGLQRRAGLHRTAQVPLPGRVAILRLLEPLVAQARAWRRATPAAQATPSVATQVALLATGAVLLAAWPLLREGWPAGALPASGIGLADLLPWSAIMLAAGATVAWAARPPHAIAALGTVGLGTSLVFARCSAPDLALTQLLVESVSVLLLALGLRALPPESWAQPVTGIAGHSLGGAPLHTPTRRALLHGLLAVAAGTGAGLLCYAVLTRPAASRVAAWYLGNALPGGGGGNVVNLIIVDFRAFDTLGEIVVLAAAALIVAATLHGLPPLRRTRDASGHAGGAPIDRLLLGWVARTLLPAVMLLSAWYLLRGHDAPGGGFIAALVLVVGLLLAQQGDGRARYAGPAPRLLALGIATSLGTGLAALALGQPFLASAHGHPLLPLVGELPLASAMVFDLGVYLTVGAAVLGLLQTMAQAGSPAGAPWPVHR